jgi:hypothetical protein
MPEHNLFQIFISRLNTLGIRYMVTGAVASIIYGEPRLTHDIDLVVELGSEKAEEVVKAFPSDEFYCPPVEIIKLEAERRLHGHFNIIHHETGFKADMYILGQDQLHQWAMSTLKSIEFEGEQVWLAPPEYVILRKLEYYREGGSEKHLRDIAGMVKIASDQINFQELTAKIKQYALLKQWKKAQEIMEKQVSR